MTTSTRQQPRLAGPPSPHPVSAGLCQFCRRLMWRQTKNERGLLKSNAAETTCVSCVAWMNEHPGQDPRERRNHAAERIPPERAESDQRWRIGRKACADAPRRLFDPDPDPDDDEGGCGAAPTFDERRAAARRYCATCPVLDNCRQTALERGYEGLWGALLIGYVRWVELDTGDFGPTVNVHGVARQRIEEAADRMRERRRASSSTSSTSADTVAA